MKKLFRLFAIALVLAGCDALMGKEVGRLQINQLSSEENLVVKETTLDLKRDEEIAIWSDMDVEYEGDVALRFRVEVEKDGNKLSAFEIDPTEKNITIGEVKTTWMDKTNWSFNGKNSTYKIEEDGKYTFRGILVASDNPTLKVTKAEIVFKK